MKSPHDLGRYAAALCLLALGGPATASTTGPDLELGGVVGASLAHREDGSGGPRLDNNASRLFLRATSALSSDWQISAYYERGAASEADGVEAVREFHLSLAGPWGEWLAGRASSDYKRSGVALDPFHDTSVAGIDAGRAREGASFGLSALSNGSVPGSLAWRSPRYRGFGGNLAVYLDDQDDAEGGRGRPDYGLGFNYSGEEPGLDAGLQYLDLGGEAVSPGQSGSALRGYGRVHRAAWSLGLSWEWLELGEDPASGHYRLLSASYALNSHDRLALAWGNRAETGADGNGVSLGLFHQFGAGLTGYVAARQVSGEGGDSTGFALGVQYTFSRGRR
jgi:hypothetical protein